MQLFLFEHLVSQQRNLAVQVMAAAGEKLDLSLVVISHLCKLGLCFSRC